MASDYLWFSGSYQRISKREPAFEWQEDEPASRDMRTEVTSRIAIWPFSFCRAAQLNARQTSLSANLAACHPKPFGNVRHA